MQCCPNMPARQVPRDVHEDARDVARRLMRTKAFLKSRDERKRVEMRFAHLKIHHGFERMRLRGLTGARDEFCHSASKIDPLKSDLMAVRFGSKRAVKGMLTVETIGRIRREHFLKGKTIKEIAR